jgi:ribokinase
MDYDFIAIGDIVTDAFIELIKNAEATCDINHEHCRLSIPFGDKIPYENVWVIPAVGNSPNAAVAASRLGLRSALVANLGDDTQGKECLASLAKNSVSLELMTVNPGLKTNYHYVLWFQDDRTILIKHEAYPYVLPSFREPKWIYLSSLGEAGLAIHDPIATYLEAHPNVKLAFQPGTFQMSAGVERLKRIYDRTEVFFCNKEEAQRILKSIEEDPKKLMQGLRELGPKTVIVTDGPKGAYAQNDEGSWFMPAYPDPKPPYERTGAGDAFSSAVIAALGLDMSLFTALQWGPINSMSVVQQIGAQAGLLTREQLEHYLAVAPVDYIAKQI